ncbi:hypothetical protein JCM11641_001247 [Rhodosporidiobolus odoratus]
MPRVQDLLTSLSSKSSSIPEPRRSWLLCSVAQPLAFLATTRGDLNLLSAYHRTGQEHLRLHQTAELTHGTLPDDLFFRLNALLQQMILYASMSLDDYLYNKSCGDPWELKMLAAERMRSLLEQIQGSQLVKHHVKENCWIAAQGLGAGGQ